MCIIAIYMPSPSITLTQMLQVADMISDSKTFTPCHHPPDEGHGLYQELPSTRGSGANTGSLDKNYRNFAIVRWTVADWERGTIQSQALIILWALYVVPVSPACRRCFWQQRVHKIWSNSVVHAVPSLSRTKWRASRHAGWSDSQDANCALT